MRKGVLRRLLSRMPRGRKRPWEKSKDTLTTRMPFTGGILSRKSFRRFHGLWEKRCPNEGEKTREKGTGKAEEGIFYLLSV